MKPFCLELAISTILKKGIRMDNLVTLAKIIKEDKIKVVWAIVTIVENLCIGQENVHI
jgi:hypothetical protein